MIDLYLLNKITKKNNTILVWDIWGKDLYEDYDKSKNYKSIFYIKFFIKEGLRKSLINKMKIFITTGDYEALQERYVLNRNAKQMQAQYSYNLLNQPILDGKKKKELM